MHLAVVAILLAIVKEEDVLAADAICFCTPACAAGVEKSTHKLVEMIFAKRVAVLFEALLAAAPLVPTS